MTAREQFATVAWLRWRVFVNGLRSRQRKAEAVGAVFLSIGMLLFGIVPGIAFAVGAYYLVSHPETHFFALSILFWIVFLYWQFIPAISIAFSEIFDASTFLRFPVTLSTYYWLWLAFGSLDPALIPPIIWLSGMFVGIVIADPLLAPIAALVLFTFALMNLLLSRLILAYAERWMAQRKTREVVGALIALSGVGFQVVIRLGGRYAVAHRNSPILAYVTNFQHALPPGIAARCIEFAAPIHPHPSVVSVGSSPHYSEAFLQLAFLLAYTIVFGLVLGIRLRGQYRGENFSETSRRGKIEKRERKVPVNRGWLGLPDPVGAVFEKELRTLMAMRQLWISMLAPPLMLLLFGKMGTGRNPIGHSPWVLPLGAAYGLLTLSGFFCNSLSGDLGGIQLLYLAPVRFRQIFIGKNLAHACIAGVQFLVLLVGVSLIFDPPPPEMLALTIAAIAYVVLANIAVGNLLSLYFPKKVDFARMNRQQGSSVTGLIMLGVQIGIVGLAAPVIFAARYFDSVWLGTGAFLLLCVLAFLAYLAVLRRVDGIALKKREAIIAEFTKAS
jgi:ABC-2 type transport system permease protein